MEEAEHTAVETHGKTVYGVSGSKWPEQRIRVELAMWAQPDLRPGEGWRERMRHVEFPPVTNRCSWGVPKLWPFLRHGGNDAKPVERRQALL